MERSQSNREIPPRRALAATGVVIVLMAVLSVQDYFDHYSLYFTAAYILLAGAAMVLVFLTPPGAASEDLSSDPARAASSLAPAAALIWTGLCAALSYLPATQSRILISALVIAGSLLSACLLAWRRSSMHVAALPALASYILMVSSPVLYMEHEWYPVRDRVFEVGVAACYLLIIIPSVVKMKGAAALALYLAAGTFLKGLGIYQWEIDPQHRDMIPLIHQGALSFLDGRHPYRIYFCGHDLPMTYLPLMWLSYVPAVAAKIEPRVMSVLFSIGSALLIYRWKGRGGGGAREEFFVYLAAVWYMQAEVIWVAVFAENTPFWFFTFFFLWAVVRDRRAEAAIFLGLMLAVRHFSLLFVPFAVVWFLLGRRGGGKETGKTRAGNLFYPALAAAIACIIVVPFIVGSAQSFFFGTLHWLTSFGPTHRTWWEAQISLSPLFYAGRHEKMLLWVQVALYSLVFLAFLIAALRRKFSPAFVRLNLWAFFSIAYILFLLFNSLMWRHLHIMGIVLILFSLVVRILPEESAGGETSMLQRALAALSSKAVAWVALALIIGAGSCIFLSGLYGFFVRDDMVRDAAVIGQELRPGDLLVDYAYSNAWPVLDGTPFLPAEFHPGIKHSLRLRSQFPPVFKRVVVVTSGKQFTVPGDAPDLMDYMKLVSTRKVGRLKVYTLENPCAGSELGRLSENIDWIQSVSLVSGEKKIFAEKIAGEFKFPDLDPRYAVASSKLFVQLADRNCVLAFPPARADLEMEVNVPLDARLWIQTGLNDYALWPGLAPVDVKVAGEDLDKLFVHPNEQGWYVWHAGRSPGDGRVRLSFSSDRRKMRFFCFDLVATRPD